MEIPLTAEQSDFIRQAVATGRVQNSGEAVQEALALWVERERRRVELLADLDAADASLARGEGLDITEDSMKSLAQDVMERNRLRFADQRVAR